MIIESGISRMHLGRGELLRLYGAAGDTVACLGGSLWITRDGAPEDVVLSAGESMRIEGSGRVLVQAFEPARVAVGPVAALGVPAAPAVPVQARLRPVRELEACPA